MLASIEPNSLSLGRGEMQRAKGGHFFGSELGGDGHREPPCLSLVLSDQVA